MPLNPQDANNAQNQFPPPQDLNDFMRRLFLLLQSIFGTAVGIIILSAIGFIILIVLAILKGS